MARVLRGSVCLSSGHESRPEGPGSGIILRPKERSATEKGEKLVIIGCGGVGGPAAMLARKLMPQVEITLVRAERRFIFR